LFDVQMSLPEVVIVGVLVVVGIAALLMWAIRASSRP